MTASRAPRGLPAAPYVHPPCLVCGGPVERRSTGPRGESAADWKQRTLCSRVCSQKHSGEMRTVAWLARNKLLELQHPPCLVCGAAVLAHKNETERRFFARGTCGAKPCAAALQSRRAKANVQAAKPSSHYAAPIREPDPDGDEWGTLSPLDYGEGFGAHNLKFKPSPGHVSKPFNQSYGVSSGWAVRHGGV